jgi:hypothetical protein
VILAILDDREPKVQPLHDKMWRLQIHRHGMTFEESLTLGCGWFRNRDPVVRSIRHGKGLRV